MQFVNHTPFPAMVFEARDHDDAPHHVLVLRATMTLAHGPARLSTEQRDLVLGDRHYGDPAESSVLEESDLAPYKPATDVLVRGTARPPGNAPATAWEVTATVGARASRLRVTGPRWWLRTDGDQWRLSDPLATAAVPLRYELAYGGTARDEHREERCDDNHVGVGFAPRWWRDARDRIEAPQIEWPDDPLTSIDRPIAPAGFGATGRAWTSRRSLAGTYDETWRTTKWPAIPGDFDMRYWCAAPRGLGGEGHLRGDERVRITGVGALPVIEFALPGHDVFALLRHESGMMMPVKMKLDTVSIDADALEVGLVWRLVTGVEPAIRVIEARMEFREPAEVARHGG